VVGCPVLTASHLDSHLPTRSLLDLFFLKALTVLPGPLAYPNGLLDLRVETFGRTPWTGDQPLARPLPTQDNTTHKHADTHPCPEQVVDSTCLRPLGHWDRHWICIYVFTFMYRCLCMYYRMLSYFTISHLNEWEIQFRIANFRLQGTRPFLYLCSERYRVRSTAHKLCIRRA
jgi:hypothetical protein